MTLRINDTAPDFTASSTQGEIKFHEWIGDSWAVDEKKDIKIVENILKERNLV